VGCLATCANDNPRYLHGFSFTGAKLKLKIDNLSFTGAKLKVKIDNSRFPASALQEEAEN
jgi:hypothetical protein